MSIGATPPVHVIVRLPYDRSEFPINDPPIVEWNAEKENMLWEVIARSRAANSGGTDWPALSAHLQVPLPYLLYRAQVRYEEDLRTLQDVKTTLTSTNLLTIRNSTEPERPSSSVPIRNLTSGVTSSLRRQTPIDRRIRTPSHKLVQEPMLSMISQSARNIRNETATPISSDSEEEEEMDAAEEETRRAQEQETVGRRLKELEKIITPDELGFFSASKPSLTNIDSSQTRSQTQNQSPLSESVRREDSVAGTSESNATSPQGSIPSIPSPHNESRSPAASSTLSSVQATTTLPRNPSQNPRLSQSPRRMVQSSRKGGAPTRNSQRANSQGSAASSFSDLSDAPSVSASALESALLSNIRGGGSRLSTFARSTFSALGRGNG